MAIDWGAWVYAGGNGMRVGIEAVSWSGVAWNSGSSTLTFNVWTQNQYTYSDAQTVSYTGGSLNYTNSQGANAQVMRVSGATAVYYYGANPGTLNISATLSGLYNGGNPTVSVDYTSPTKPAPAPPSAPGISVAALGNGYVDFSFSAPGYGGEAGVAYYQSSTDNVNWGTQNNNPFRHYGSNGTTVYGYIRAVDNVGQAGPSAGTSGVPRTVPGTVSTFTANNSTVGQLVLNWTAPASNGGSAITGYTLKRGAVTLLTNANQLTYTDTGLTPASTYLYEISAVNAAGTGSGFNKSFETLGGVVNVKRSASGYDKIVPQVRIGTSWVKAQARVRKDGQWKYGT